MHVPSSTRGAFTALCALLPARSAKKVLGTIAGDIAAISTLADIMSGIPSVVGEHPKNCGEVLAEDVMVRLWKVQIQVEGWEETAIAAYWVTDGKKLLHFGGKQPTLGKGVFPRVPRENNGGKKKT